MKQAKGESKGQLLSLPVVLTGYIFRWIPASRVQTVLQRVCKHIRDVIQAGHGFECTDWSLAYGKGFDSWLTRYGTRIRQLDALHVTSDMLDKCPNLDSIHCVYFEHVHRMVDYLQQDRPRPLSVQCSSLELVLTEATRRLGPRVECRTLVYPVTGLESITDLYLSNTQVTCDVSIRKQTQQTLFRILEMGRLLHLTLGKTWTENQEDLNSLSSRLHSCSQLVSLTLFDASYVQDEFLTVLKQACPKLEDLTLCDYTMTPQETKTLATFSSLKRLALEDVDVLNGQDRRLLDLTPLDQTLNLLWIASVEGLWIRLSRLPRHIKQLTIEDHLDAADVVTSSCTFAECTTLEIPGNLYPTRLKWTLVRCRALLNHFPNLISLDLSYSLSPYVLYTLATTTGLPHSLKTICCRAPRKVEYNKTVEFRTTSSNLSTLKLSQYVRSDEKHGEYISETLESLLVPLVQVFPKLSELQLMYWNVLTEQDQMQQKLQLTNSHLVIKDVKDD